MAAVVKIEREECIICGSCWVECPDFFEEGPDEGLTQVAADLCPSPSSTWKRNRGGNDITMREWDYHVKKFMDEIG